MYTLNYGKTRNCFTGCKFSSLMRSCNICGRGGIGRRARFRSVWANPPWRFESSRPHQIKKVCTIPYVVVYKPFFFHDLCSWIRLCRIMAVSKPNNIPTTPHKETQYIRGNGAKRNRNAIPLPNVVPARKPSERPIGLSDFNGFTCFFE